MALTRPRAYQIYDIDYKQAVRVVATTNVTLAGGAPNTVDGVGLSLNDRILVVGQSSASQNGIYYVTTVGSGSNGTWARSTDTNATGELLSGTIVMVTEGTSYADTQWKLTTNDPITIGSTELTFVQNYLANSISFGQTSFAIGSSNANATVSVAGTSNVAVFSTSGVDVAGNVSATYFIGNGSQLTGISASTSGFPISAGTSNIAAAANSNIRISIAGTSNISVFSTSGQSVTGNITATGNVGAANLTASDQLSVSSTATIGGTATVGVLQVGASGIASRLTTNGAGFDDWIGVNKSTGNIWIGGGSQTGYVSVGQGTSNSIVYIARGQTTSGLTKTISIGDNGLAGSITSIIIGNTLGSGNVTVSANTLFTISNTSGSALNVVGNVTGGNLTTAGQVSATGNITSSGNVTGGNLLTGGLVTATGNITSSGNVSATYLLGNVYYATGFSASKIYNGTSEINISTANGAANVSIGGTSNVAVFSSTGVAIIGDLSVSGNATLSGNILGDRLQNGTTSIDIQTADGNANISVAGTSNVVVFSSAGQNVTGYITSSGNVTGGNLLTAGLVSATGNVTGGNLITSGLISATGNITSVGNISGSYILGNGSQLTGIVTGNSFGIITVSGQSDVVADQATDTLALVAGTGISITTDAGTDTVTISSIATDSIFATGGNMGTIDETVLVSEDLGLVTDAATVEYDLGTETTSGIVTPSLLLLPSYTVAQLGSLTAAPAGQFVFCSNESGGSIPAFSDGTNWRRVSDRSIVS